MEELRRSQDADEFYDLVVIGGGVNGTSVAREASHRGLSVLLCERDDLASHTSSASSKLIHGGLRYLENYEFRLVREALREREVLLRAAPHIVWPMRFILPHGEGLRPRWMLRAGLFLYDNLAERRVLPRSRMLDLHRENSGASLKPQFTTGFEYSDCWVEDSRLAILYARDAADHGAAIRTRTEVISIKQTPNGFFVGLRALGGASRFVKAKCVVNAAGPWVDAVLGLGVEGKQTGQKAETLRLIKGSHIVVNRIFEGSHAFIFQNPDNRVVFALPFEGGYTLIGTTDVPYDPQDGPPRATPEEIAYLCDAVSEYFTDPVTPADVVHTFSGVRPLYEDQALNASDVTRDYVLKLHAAEDSAILSVYGGKVTTSRKLGVTVLNRLKAFFPSMGPGKPDDTPLPGGALDMAFSDFKAQMSERYPGVSKSRMARLCRLYGANVESILTSEGADYVLPGDICLAELRYLISREWAWTACDVLWRRTRQGLHMTEQERCAFERAMVDELPSKKKIESENVIATKLLKRCFEPAS